MLSKTEGMQLARDYAMRRLNDAPTLMLFLRSGMRRNGANQPQAESELDSVPCKRLSARQACDSSIACNAATLTVSRRPSQEHVM